MEYDITHFRPEHEPQVLDVLGNLWKSERDQLAGLFRWKYLENPQTDNPLGIVALYDGQVVGFRGYFANRFVIGGQDQDVVILHPGDTCVDPKHRRQGLSVRMGGLAMQCYFSDYSLFLNMTSSPNSLPGYLKMGFKPLASKNRLRTHSLNPLVWMRKRQRVSRHPTPNRVRLGQFGNFLVTDSLQAAQMASVIAAEKPPKGVFRLRQDQVFFEWRYRNPVKRYAFYFLMDGNAARGYVAMSASTDFSNGEILDYGGRDEQAIPELLSFIVESKHFSELSILSYGVDERFASLLNKLGFSKTHPLKRVMRFGVTHNDAPPLLIRPVTKSCTEQDFFIGSVDVRKAENWRLKPICSDAA